MKSINLISILFVILISSEPSQCNIALQSCLQACQQNVNHPNPDQCINACVIATTTTTNDIPNRPIPQQHYYPPAPQQQLQPVTSTSFQTYYILGFVAILVVVGFIWHTQNQKNHEVELKQQNIENKTETDKLLNQERYNNIQQDHRRYDADINDNRTDIRTLAVGQSGLQAATGQLRADHDAHRLEYNRAVENQNMFNREITGNLATQTSNLNSLQLEFSHNRDQFNDFRDRQIGFNQAISNQVHDNQANIQAVQHQVEQQLNNPLQQILGMVAPFAAPLLGGVGKQAVRALTNTDNGNRSSGSSSRNSSSARQRPTRRSNR